jgi:formamidopyrimidine-DNA glycosylase
MPEGPECKIIAEYLKKSICDTQLTNIIIHPKSRYTRHGPPVNFEKLEYPREIDDVGVKGKLIWIKTGQYYILNTLGMSGMWTLKNGKHCDVELCLQAKPNIFFKDMRHFGTLKIVDQQGFDKKLASIGYDVFDFCDFKTFSELLSKKSSWTLPKFLMSQKHISGIGNYLKCEILYRLKVSPHRLIRDLSTEEITKLYDLVQELPVSSYTAQGVSIRDYQPPEKYRDGLKKFALLVYNHDVDSHGYQVIRETTSDRRTTHWVHELQK